MYSLRDELESLLDSRRVLAAVFFLSIQAVVECLVSMISCHCVVICVSFSLGRKGFGAVVGLFIS